MMSPIDSFKRSGILSRNTSALGYANVRNHPKRAWVAPREKLRDEMLANLNGSTLDEMGD